MSNKAHKVIGILTMIAGISAMVAVVTLSMSGEPLEVANERVGSTTVEHIRAEEVAEVRIVEVSGPGAARVRPKRESDRGTRRKSDGSPKGEGRAAATVEPRGLDVSLGLPTTRRSLREHYSGVPSFRANKAEVGASQKVPQGNSETVEIESGL